MPMTRFSLLRDINGRNAFGLMPSNTKFSGVIRDQYVDYTFTVPPTDDFDYPHVALVFSYQPGAFVWVAVNATPSLPAPGALTPTNSELNPVVRRVFPGDVIHILRTMADPLEIGILCYACK